jgi:flavin-dependent dehydrogenase
MVSCDLIVVGGGPAGTSAAICAARAGASVLLLERGRYPRHKVCGEFVSAESLDLLGKLLHDSSLLRHAIRISHARVFLDGRTLQTAVDPPAASIARLDLDDALWQSAQSTGVEVRQQVTVRGISGGGPFRVATTAGEFKGRAVVNASGRWSNLNLPAARENGSGEQKWLGIKGHFAETATAPSVDLYFFEGGYCGVQPVSVSGEGAAAGRINAAAMVRADVASTLPEVFAQQPALHQRSRGWAALSDPVSTSPLMFRDPQPERDGVLCAGDAAGFVDPFVGDGISLALRSGWLAAESLVPFFAGTVPLADAVGKYREVYRQSLLRVFRASSKIRQMLRLPRSVRKPLLLLLEKNPALTQFMVKRTR